MNKNSTLISPIASFRCFRELGEDLGVIFPCAAKAHPSLKGAIFRDHGGMVAIQGLWVVLWTQESSMVTNNGIHNAYSLNCSWGTTSDHAWLKSWEWQHGAACSFGLRHHPFCDGPLDPERCLGLHSRSSGLSLAAHLWSRSLSCVHHCKPLGRFASSFFALLKVQLHKFLVCPSFHFLLSSSSFPVILGAIMFLYLDTK